jgi:hypothetical protein
MIFSLPPNQKPLLIQTVDGKKVPFKLFVLFMLFFCISLIGFYSDGQKEFLNMAIFAGALFALVYFILLFRTLINPYRFRIYEEGMDIRGLGLCPWRLIIGCEYLDYSFLPYFPKKGGATGLWKIKLSCAENDALSNLKKLNGARNVVFLKEENVLQITYEAAWELSKINFDNFNVLIKRCIQSAERNNGHLKVGLNTDQRFELIS